MLHSELLVIAQRGQGGVPAELPAETSAHAASLAILKADGTLCSCIVFEHLGSAPMTIQPTSAGCADESVAR